MYKYSITAPRYRIKKTGHSHIDGVWTYRYMVQWRLWWLPFWVNPYMSEGYNELESAQKDIKDAIWDVYSKKYHKSYIHHTFSVPDHIPKEQEERFLKMKGEENAQV